MSKIELDKATRETLSRLVIRHLKAEFDVEIEPFDGQRLVDFLSEALGPHYYNQGLSDAQAIVRDRADAVVEAIYAIEKPVMR